MERKLAIEVAASKVDHLLVAIWKTNNAPARLVFVLERNSCNGLVGELDWRAPHVQWLLFSLSARRYVVGLGD